MTVKEKTLMMLEKNRDMFFSGEKLAEEIGVSRNAIWKAIKQLEVEGYKIEAVRNKGYRLDQENNVISSQGIRLYLNDTFKHLDIQAFTEVTSTNDEAKELAMAGATHGTLIVANEQTKGRGRYGRRFESPKDTGIYMSIILDPKQLGSIPKELLTAYVAVVVSDVLSKFSQQEVGIKWVNDLFIKGKKVAGILTEASTNLETGDIDWIVVGIGINVSTTTERFSKDIQHVATSLFNQEVSTLINRNELIADLANQLLSDTNEKNLSEVMEAYRHKSIVIGEVVKFQSGDIVYEGVAQTILDDGSLVIKTTQGEEKQLRFGEISINI